MDGFPSITREDRAHHLRFIRRTIFVESHVLETAGMPTAEKVAKPVNTTSVWN